jgi:hypothetical protein
MATFFMLICLNRLLFKRKSLYNRDYNRLFEKSLTRAVMEQSEKKIKKQKSAFERLTQSGGELSA